MNITGQIFATSDLGVVHQSAINGFKLIYVGDTMEIPKGYDWINAVSFSPDYQSMCAVIEGDDNLFAKLYYQNLSTPVAEQMFAVIIAAVCKGVNIMIYFPDESIQLRYPYLLLQFMRERYGLTAGDRQSGFTYNPSYDLINLRLLYLYNLIDWKMYITVSDEVDPVTLAKLKSELCPIYKIPTTISDADFIVKIDKIKEELLNPKPLKLFTEIKKEEVVC